MEDKKRAPAAESTAAQAEIAADSDARQAPELRAFLCLLRPAMQNASADRPIPTARLQRLIWDLFSRAIDLEEEHSIAPVRVP